MVIFGVIVTYNDVWENNVVAISDSGTNTYFSHNRGYVTENSGSAVPNNNSSVTFNHGLVTTPVIVQASFNATGYGARILRQINLLALARIS